LSAQDGQHLVGSHFQETIYQRWRANDGEFGLIGLMMKTHLTAYTVEIALLLWPRESALADSGDFFGFLVAANTPGS
jgi:hypothetical protein